MFIGTARVVAGFRVVVDMKGVAYKVMIEDEDMASSRLSSSSSSSS